LLQGESLSVNNASSLSLRWHAQLFGLESWLQRPWFGWGPGSSRHLMRESGAPGVFDQDGVVLKHLHNSYLELLSQFGLLGLGFWLSLAVALVWSVNASRTRGELSPDLASFLILSLLYLALWSLFNFRMVHQDFRGYWALLAGAALTFGLYPREPANQGGNLSMRNASV
jgi:O-antigen ligase